MGWQGNPQGDKHMGLFVAGPEYFLTAEQTPTVSPLIRCDSACWLNG
jgi:hypothetical protein